MFRFVSTLLNEAPRSGAPNWVLGLGESMVARLVVAKICHFLQDFGNSGTARARRAPTLQAYHGVLKY